MTKHRVHDYSMATAAALFSLLGACDPGQLAAPELALDSTASALTVASLSSSSPTIESCGGKVVKTAAVTYSAQVSGYYDAPLSDIKHQMRLSLRDSAGQTVSYAEVPLNCTDASTGSCGEVSRTFYSLGKEGSYRVRAEIVEIDYGTNPITEEVVEDVVSNFVELTTKTTTPGCPLAGSWYDSQNCYVTALPAGTEGFVFDGKLYYTPQGRCTVGNYDGANCYLGTPPQGSVPFELNKNVYYSPQRQCAMGSFDGANCYVGAVPAGSRAFMYDGNLYYTPVQGSHCPVPGSSFDSRNCFVAGREHRPFIYNNNLYVSSTGSSQCPLPYSRFDGANCIMDKSFGTSGFVYQGKLYSSAIRDVCPLSGSRFDGKNCYVATVPAGSKGFVWNRALYYSPVCK